MKVNKGFSLIEVMIVIVIVGILASVALPSYQQYLLRGARAEAQSHMMDIASRQGQFLIDNRAFAASVSALGMTTPTSISSKYTISMTADAAPPIFTITATPSGSQTRDTCGTLTLNNAGAKTPSTGSCW
ncbi:MAG: type IV pilin protein [Rhodocyclaceae bacterium]|nr:type IV pilin protein [Rhodocyclaceae bacterium]